MDILSISTFAIIEETASAYCTHFMRNSNLHPYITPAMLPSATREENCMHALSTNKADKSSLTILLTFVYFSLNYLKIR